jgi:DNA-binding transcriptional LysR family regulator
LANRTGVELRHLRYFLAVAEELSFRKAAERLHLAQPPLSAQIKGLEEELGTKLFERTTRSVRLTQAGRILMEEARIVLSAAERAEQRTRKADQGLVGLLRIGVIRPAANDRLAAILRRFRNEFPGVGLTLRDLASTQQIEALRNDELDIGLLRPPIGFPELDFVFLEESAMVLAAPQDHPLAQGGVLEQVAQSYRAPADKMLERRLAHNVPGTTCRTMCGGLAGTMCR